MLAAEVYADILRNLSRDDLDKVQLVDVRSCKIVSGRGNGCMISGLVCQTPRIISFYLVHVVKLHSLFLRFPLPVNTFRIRSIVYF